MLPRSPELEAEILRAPDDPVPYLVYADWLGEHSDPLGELILLQHRRTPATEGRELMLIRAEIRSELPSRATLPVTEDFQLSWHWGFVRTVRFKRSMHLAPPDLFAMLGELLNARCGPFVRELDLDLDRFGVQPQQLIDFLITLGKPALLERLSLGRVVTRPSGLDMSRLLQKFPRFAGLTRALDRPALELVSVAGSGCSTMEVGDRYLLDPFAPTTVGRAAGVDIVVADDRINRRNFGVDMRGGQWWFSHYGGTHPIGFNGIPSRGQHQLKEGDLIEPVPGLQFRFRLSSAP